MPSSSRRKYYAVREGRQGPKIYDTWSECHANVSRWPRAEYKSFTSREDAVQWVAAPSRRAISSAESSVPPCPSTTTPTTDSNSVTFGDNKAEHSQMSSLPPPPQDIVLSAEQRKVLAMVQRGENVFFTGSAGGVTCSIY
ncbi:hypothetical protein EV401DRAFT_857923 [Pisolithus croceorrhizus]|nr:hypothetical protein EV401DRAFT_857923 [Pisolithus croceorrhizus]